MDGAWQIVKWVWVAVCFIWLVVQVVALRRLKGDLKRRSMYVFWVVFVLIVVSDWIREVFEFAQATRIGMLVVGVAATVATILLVGMLRGPDAVQNVDGPDVDGDGHIRRLKLG